MFCSVYSVSMCRSVYCLCVNVHCTAVTGVSTQLQLANTWVLSSLLKIIYFTKIHLQSFNVIFIVLYHSGPTFGASLVFLSGRLRFWCSWSVSHAVVSSILGTSRSLVGSCPDCTAVGEALGIHNFPKISDTVPVAWRRALMYDRWSLREVWLQPASPSISRLRCAERWPRSLPNTHTAFFTEVWLTAVPKTRTIASSCWPRKRSVHEN